MVNIPFVDKFPVDVILFQRRGDSYIIKSDKARFITKEENRKVYELKKRGEETQPMSYKYMRVKGNGDPILFLLEYERGQFAPLDLNKDKELEPIDQADVAWEQYTTAIADELHEKKIPWYQKYQSFIVMVVTGLFIIILAWIFMKQISTASQNIVEAFKQGLQQSAASSPPG